MAGYLSFEEYAERGGTLDAAAFAALEPRARGRVDALTYGRLRGMQAVPEAVKDAMMCAIGVMDSCGAEALAAASVQASFATDGYSESYQGAGERVLAAQRALDREIGTLLAGLTDDEGVPLIYAGGVVG